jgi:hypothetical protein
MESRLRRVRGWRDRVRSLPRRERSLRLGWVWAGSAVLLLVGFWTPGLKWLAVAATFPLVWVSGDLELARLVTALTGGKLGDSPHIRWLLWIPRAALMLLAAFLVLGVLEVCFGR